MRPILWHARAAILIALIISVAIIFAGAVSWCGLVVGSVITSGLLQVAQRGLVIALFVIALFFGTSFFVLIGLLPAVFSTSSLRLFAVIGVITAYLGLFGGAVWVLWLHGDPSRILLLR